MDAEACSSSSAADVQAAALCGLERLRSQSVPDGNAILRRGVRRSISRTAYVPPVCANDAHDSRGCERMTDTLPRRSRRRISTRRSSACSRRSRRSGACRRPPSRSRWTGSSSPAAPVRRSSTSAATTASTYPRCATSPSCPASARAGCAWWRSRARSIRRSAARARLSRTWSSTRRRTRLREIRKTNLELIFSDHNAYCLPPCQNKCPSHIDIPGFLKANTEGNFAESARIFKRTIPFPSILGRVCPGPVRGALPARRGRGSDCHSRQPPLRGRPGTEGASRRCQGAGAVRSAAARRASAWP